MENVAWWQKAVIYQIYPRSFFDANGDGVGDLAGILKKLPYLAGLGIDAVWLSPIFKSPMVDFGYDISNHCVIDPLFGSMDEFDEVLAACRRLGMRLILDLVPNHTSSAHPWFVESRSSRSSLRRDWYIWRDAGPNGDPPNNWLSVFGGSGWEWDGVSGQFYFHTFLNCQPDLNWRNPEVRTAVEQILRFWLDKGVDGFRMDALWYILKDEQFRDNPVNPHYREGQPPDYRFLPLYTADLDEIHEIIADLRRVADAYADRLLIGEIYLPPAKLVAYYGKNLAGVHLPFNFSLLEVAWHARTLADLIDDYEAVLPEGSWPNWVLGNHDRPRIASRVGEEQSRVAAMLLLTLRGTPTIYYGDELGMTLAEIPPDRMLDPLEANMPGLGLGRDASRSPMPWSDATNAGFSSGEPWCPLIGDWRSRNVTVLDQDPVSILSLHRQLLTLRKHCPSLTAGCYRPLRAAGDLLMYIRTYASADPILVALNLGPTPQTGEVANFRGRVLLSTLGDRRGDDVDCRVALRPNEGLVMLALASG